jgi:hypothetical protein
MRCDDLKDKIQNLQDKIAGLEKDLAMVRCVVSAYPESYKQAEERGAKQMSHCAAEFLLGKVSVSYSTVTNYLMRLWHDGRGSK